MSISGLNSTPKSVSDCGSPYREKLRTAGSKPGIRTGSMFASWPIVDTAKPVCSSSSETERRSYDNILNLRKKAKSLSLVTLIGMHGKSVSILVYLGRFVFGFPNTKSGEVFKRECRAAFDLERQK